ncbi:MAG: hypothetical protein A3I66_12620 [Burkholderiales bacterium RIFCSPLOWO2_02_FULL_57_36]|nr:MAG: hypothetical protein A3I66_12620 [Burkholderiales bacterium RIFCSPLOWO2_02_FULL_57_36]
MTYMKRFIEGRDRTQGTLLSDQLADYVANNNPVRVVDVFVDEMERAQMKCDELTQQKPGDLPNQ